MSSYTVKDGVIISEDSIPYLPRFLADERISAKVTGKGLGDIEYFCPDTQGNCKIFAEEFWGGLRYYIRAGGDVLPFDAGKCMIRPFGYESEWKNSLAPVKFKQFLADNCIITEILSEAEPAEPINFGFEFYGSYAFTPYPYGDLRYKSGVKRSWREWSFEDGVLSGGFDEDTGSVGVCFAANYDWKFSRTARNVKYRLYSGTLEAGRVYRTVTAFAPNTEKARSLAEKALKEAERLYFRQISRYKKVADRAPKLESAYPRLNDFFALAPYYHESLKISEHPGALRAKTTNYWVWGWDGMTANEASAYWGDTEYLADMLEMYKRFTARGEPVPHAFSRDMKGIEPCPPPAEGMYITLLYLYYSAGGNPAEYYGFAKEIFRRIESSATAEAGLCRGTSLFPDFRILLKETGNDISSFNNTVCYCALRSMERLAAVMGDKDTSQSAAYMAERIFKNFMPVMYDAERGFVACSADAETLSRRNVFSSNSLKWENSFLRELTFGKDSKFINFFKRNTVTERGLREVPSWCVSYDEDANQLHCWWPVTGEYFSRLAAASEDEKLSEKWIGWVEYWTERLMCPEGIPCYENTPEVPFDNWNCRCGTWQAYSIRGFYQAAVHGIVGIEAGEGGYTVLPSHIGGITLKGMHYGDMSADITTTGSGAGIEKIVFNGKSIYGTRIIPSELLRRHNSIEIFRKKEPEKVCILSGTGATLSGYSCESGRIEDDISSSGKIRLFIRVTGKTKITADGKGIFPKLLFDNVAALEFNGGDKSIRLVLEDEAICF